jgi:hypothetical protein
VGFGARTIAPLLAVALTASACSLLPRQAPAVAEAPGPSQTPEPTAVPSPTPSPVPIPGHLGEALAFVPPITSSVSFTDWTALKTGVGAARLTGTSSFSAKAAALKNEATPAGFGLRFLGAHRYDWGFDVMDLDWDLLVIPVSGPPVWALRFRDGFDLGPFKHHLDDRGFKRETVQGGQLFTHPLDAQASWVSSTELAILNTALLADRRTAVLSSDEAPVRDILQHGPVDGLIASGRRVADLLGTPAAMTMLLGHQTCSDLVAGLPTSPGELRAGIDAELRSAGTLHAYDALAISYSRADQVIGRIVMGYDDAAAASADVAGRTTLAQTGTSIASGGTYADTVFTLAHAAAEDGTIVFDVSPGDDQPARLFAMVDDRDMLFASCTPT